MPVPSTDVSLRDDEGREVAQGEPGELCCKGPQVMAGYWRRPDATAESMTEDGYFKTGDIAVMDEEGFFRIVDRKKDMIPVSYTHLTLPTTCNLCRSRWSPDR